MRSLRSSEYEYTELVGELGDDEGSSRLVVGEEAAVGASLYPSMEHWVALNSSRDVAPSLRRVAHGGFAVVLQDAIRDAVSPLEFRTLVDRVAALQGELDGLRVELASPRQTVLISEVPGYQLRSPLAAVLESVGDGYLASLPELDFWIDGYSESEAVDELKAAVASLADELFTTDDSDLGPAPRRWKRLLERIAVRQG